MPDVNPRTQRYLPWIVASSLFMEQMDATTVAPPGAKVFNDRHGYLHIELG